MRAGLLLVAMMMSASVSAAEVRGVVALGMMAAMKAAAPEFERASGHHLDLVFEPPGVALKRLREGERFDVIIMPREGLEAMAKEGFASLDGAVEVASAVMGIAVAKGAPVPDISSPDSLKRALLAARSIVHSDPSRGGAGGLASVRLFGSLGIAEEMKHRTVYPRVHSPAGVAQEVADGRAEIALNQVQELMQPALHVVGPFPGELQQGIAFWTVASAKATGPANDVIDYLQSRPGREVLRAHGLQTPR